MTDLLRNWNEALEKNDVEKVRNFLYKNPELANEAIFKPPLWIAAGQGNLKIVELLIKFGAFVPLIRQDGTVLHWMAANVLLCTEIHLLIGEILIQQGADVNAHNFILPETPLDEAIEVGNTKFAEFLLLNGATFNGSTAKNFIIAGCREDMLKLLLKYDLHTFLIEHQKSLFCILASFTGGMEYKCDTKTAEILLDHGVSIDEIDEKGNSPLHYSIENQNMELVSFLVTRGADVNKRNYFGVAPLHNAVESGFLHTIKLFLSKGADVNVRDRWIFTPLHLACINMHDVIISLLLRKGADISPEDHRARTPFSLLKYTVRDQDRYKLSVSVMVKEFAKLSFAGEIIHRSDIDLIRANPTAQMHFDKCLEELAHMADEKFYGTFSYYSILKMSKNIRRLARLVKNDEFTANFRAGLVKLDNFIYKDELTKFLEEAVAVKNGMDTVFTRLNHIFKDYLPEIILRKLMDDLAPEDLPLQ